MNEETKTVLEQLNQLNDTLWGMPGGALTFVFVCVLAITLKWWKVFPNEWIPRAAIICGIGAFFCLAADRGTMSAKLYVGKNIIVGFIVSALATAFVLRFGKKLPIIGKYLNGETGDTTFTSKTP